MNAAFLLVAASAAVMGSLGGVHLLCTYRGRKLEPRDPGVREAMARSTLFITRETTVWRANKGFNASHSLSLIVFALEYGYLALRRPDVLASSPVLLVQGMLVLLAYLALCRRYFFTAPLLGTALACLLYASGWALSFERPGLAPGPTSDDVRGVRSQGVRAAWRVAASSPSQDCALAPERSTTSSLYWSNGWMSV